MPVSVFVSYAHEDRAWCERLLEHLGWLRHAGQLAVFDDQQIKPGERWDERIQGELVAASIVVPLISPSFIGSRYCSLGELVRALDTGKLLIPVLVDHVDLKALPVSPIQCLPKDEREDLKPLVDWPNPNRALAAIAAEVREAAAGFGGDAGPARQAVPPLGRPELAALGRSPTALWLGRGAALVAAAGGILIASGTGAEALPVTFAAARGTLLFQLGAYALPSLVVLAQLIAEFAHALGVRRRRKRVLRSEVADAGYFRLTPYTTSDRDRFTRGDGADRRVLQWVEGATTPVLYLSGESGVGKSSLLMASLLPSLRERGWLALTVRGLADPAAALVAAVRVPGVVWPRPPAESDLVRLLLAAGREAKRQGRRLAVVLDQFEEVLLQAPPARLERFASALRALASAPRADPILLVVLRTEYEPQLLELDLPPLRQGETWLKLGAFTEPAARAFLRGSGLGLDDEQLGRVLGGAGALEQTRGLYRPIIVNMLGLVLSRYSGSLPADLPLERVIQRYLDECISRPDVRDAAAELLPRMITEADTKRPRSETDLVAAANLPLGTIRATLLALADVGLVRSLGSEPPVWEVAHDFVALQLGLRLGRVRDSLARRAGPVLVPLLTLTWLGILGGSFLFLPKWRYKEAASELNQAVVRTDEPATEGPWLSSRDDRASGPIEELSIVYEDAATTVAILPYHPTLKRLAIRFNSVLASLQGLNNLPGLQAIDIGYNGALASLPPLDGLPALQALTIEGNDELASLPPLDGLPGLQRLQDLTLVDNGTTFQVPGLAALRAVRRVALRGVPPSVLAELSATPDLSLIVLPDQPDFRSVADELLRRREVAGLITPTYRFLRTDDNHWDADPFGAEE